MDGCEADTPLLAPDADTDADRRRRRPEQSPQALGVVDVAVLAVGLVVVVSLWGAFVFAALHPRADQTEVGVLFASLSPEEEGALDKLTTRLTERRQHLQAALAGPVLRLPPALRDRFVTRLEVLDSDLAQWQKLDNATRLALAHAFKHKAGEARHLVFEMERLLNDSHAHHNTAHARHNTQAQAQAQAPHQQAQPTSPIPRVIHMTWANRALQGVSPNITAAVQSWYQKNPGWEVRVWDDCDVRDFVFTEFPKFAAEFEQLIPVERADLFRYLVLLRHGGVYTDIDTVCLEPIDNWDRTHTARALVGLEANFPSLQFARSIGAVRQVQFCQWTIAAAPNHPLLASVAHRVLDRQGDHQHDGNDEVMMTTGPGVWSDAVSDYLDWFLLAPGDVVEGVVVGDVKFLDIQAFGNTQGHSGAKRWDNPDVKGRAFVHHLFSGSWRHHDAKVDHPSCSLPPAVPSPAH